jgi:hypothetical protein
VKIRGALVIAVLAVAVVMPAQAKTVGTLTAANRLVTWSDSVDTGFINPLLVASPVPELRCLQPGACDTFTVDVALGATFWKTNGTGAVEFAIRWAYDGIIDLDLQVLDAAGNKIAQSAAVDSNAESVFIPNATDGVYTVKVIPSNTFSPGSSATEVPYDALAQVEILASDPPGEGHPMIPNLRPAPPDGFHIASAANLLPIPENKFLSCYPEETIQNPGNPTRCLRFNQTIANVGEGPMVMRFGLAGIVTPSMDDNIIVQRIFSTDGSYQDVTVPEHYVFHEVHGHLHYQGFGQTILYNWSQSSGRGTIASVGHKVGFCMIDVQMQPEYWGKTGNGPRAHTFPFDCVLPDEVDPTGPQAWVEQGVQVGWADVYGWNLADQYVDITNVKDGVYELVQIANPNNSVIESTAADNCTSTVIRIKGDKVTTPVGPGSAVPCPAY